MADSTYLRSNIYKFMQDLLSETIRDTQTEEMPTLSVLTGFLAQRSAGSTDGIGVPSSDGALFTAQKISKLRRRELMASQTYLPLIYAADPTDDGKVMSQRDTMPAVSNWNTTGHPLTSFVRPIFKYVRRVQPLKVPNEDLEATATKYAANPGDMRKALGDLWGAEVQRRIKVEMRWWNTALFSTTSAPSNVDAEGCWDAPYSLVKALDASSVYAGVDRSLAANAYWRGQTYATAIAKSLVTISDYANYTLNCAKYGTPVKLFITGSAIFTAWLAEARAIGASIVQASDIPEFAKIGFKRQVIQYNNAYAFCDFTCPANYVFGLNPDTWTIALKPNANFTVTKPYDESESEGGDDATTAKIKTRMMMACEAPNVNCVFSNVTL